MRIKIYKDGNTVYDKNLAIPNGKQVAALEEAYKWLRVVKGVVSEMEIPGEEKRVLTNDNSTVIYYIVEQDIVIWNRKNNDNMNRYRDWLNEENRASDLIDMCKNTSPKVNSLIQKMVNWFLTEEEIGTWMIDEESDIVDRALELFVCNMIQLIHGGDYVFTLYYYRMPGVENVDEIITQLHLMRIEADELLLNLDKTISILRNDF